MATKQFSAVQARNAANHVSGMLDLMRSKRITPAMLARGMNVEIEHGKRFGLVTNVTHDRATDTARIALAHLIENRRYYEKLSRMEKGLCG